MPKEHREAVERLLIQLRKIERDLIEDVTSLSNLEQIQYKNKISQIREWLINSLEFNPNLSGPSDLQSKVTQTLSQIQQDLNNCFNKGLTNTPQTSINNDLAKLASEATKLTAHAANLEEIAMKQAFHADKLKTHAIKLIKPGKNLSDLHAAFLAAEEAQKAADNAKTTAIAAQSAANPAAKAFVSANIKHSLTDLDTIINERISLLKNDLKPIDQIIICKQNEDRQIIDCYKNIQDLEKQLIHMAYNINGRYIKFGEYFIQEEHKQDIEQLFTDIDDIKEKLLKLIETPSEKRNCNELDRINDFIKPFLRPNLNQKYKASNDDKDVLAYKAFQEEYLRQQKQWISQNPESKVGFNGTDLIVSRYTMAKNTPQDIFYQPKNAIRALRSDLEKVKTILTNPVKPGAAPSIKK